MKWDERKTYYNEYFFTSKMSCLDSHGCILRHDPAWIASGEMIIEMFNPSSILDCGCATGWLVYGIYSIRPDIKIYGFDLSDYIISKALFAIQDKVFVLDLATQQLPFSDLSFDLVVALDFFEHQDDEHLNHIMKELTRIANKNIFIRQPMVKFNMDVTERGSFIESFNHLSHKERLSLIDTHELILSSIPDMNCPYHPQEKGRDFWCDMFRKYGFNEKQLEEQYYHFPNALSLSSFSTLVFSNETIIHN